jgi:hypothetical protein
MHAYRYQAHTGHKTHEILISSFYPYQVTKYTAFEIYQLVGSAQSVGIGISALATRVTTGYFKNFAECTNQIAFVAMRPHLSPGQF